MTTNPRQCPAPHRGTCKATCWWLSASLLKTHRMRRQGQGRGRPTPTVGSVSVTFKHPWERPPKGEVSLWSSNVPGGQPRAG